MTERPSFDPQFKLVTSPILSSVVLCAVRLSFGFFALATVLFVWIWSGVKHNEADQYLSYFTHLSDIGLFFYFFITGFHTLSFVKNGQTGYPLQRWPGALQYLQELFYTTIVTFPLLVTIVYWALLASSDSLKPGYNAFSNISQHILNTTFAFFEILFTNNRPMPWLHLPISVVILLGYLAVAYITHAAQGFYPYNFLDVSKGPARLAEYIVGIAVAQCFIFLIVRGIVALRQRVFGTFVRMGDDGPHTDEEKA